MISIFGSSLLTGLQKAFGFALGRSRLVVALLEFGLATDRASQADRKYLLAFGLAREYPSWARALLRISNNCFD